MINIYTVYGPTRLGLTGRLHGVHEIDLDSEYPIHAPLVAVSLRWIIQELMYELNEPPQIFGCSIP